MFEARDGIGRNCSPNGAIPPNGIIPTLFSSYVTASSCPPISSFIIIPKAVTPGSRTNTVVEAIILCSSSSRAPEPEDATDLSMFTSLLSGLFHLHPSAMDDQRTLNQFEDLWHRDSQHSPPQHRPGCHTANILILYIRNCSVYCMAEMWLSDIKYCTRIKEIGFNIDIFISHLTTQK